MELMERGQPFSNKPGKLSEEKKSISPVQEITFNGKPSHIVLVKADFPGFEELCPAATTFSQSKKIHIGCIHIEKERNFVTPLIREMKAVAF